VIYSVKNKVQERHFSAKSASKAQMERLIADLKHCFRMLRRSPGFTATAISVLALGIGAATAIFSVVNTVLLKPLPYPEPDRIVMLLNAGPQGNFPGASVPKYNVWRAQAQVLDDVAAYDNGISEVRDGQGVSGGLE
jgi:putative ABC transport system permease protein